MEITNGFILPSKSAISFKNLLTKFETLNSLIIILLGSIISQRNLSGIEALNLGSRITCVSSAEFPQN